MKRAYHVLALIFVILLTGCSTLTVMPTTDTDTVKNSYDSGYNFGLLTQSMSPKSYAKIAESLENAKDKKDALITNLKAIKTMANLTVDSQAFKDLEKIGAVISNGGNIEIDNVLALTDIVYAMTSGAPNVPESVVALYSGVNKAEFLTAWNSVDGDFKAYANAIMLSFRTIIEELNNIDPYLKVRFVAILIKMGVSDIVNNGISETNVLSLVGTHYHRIVGFTNGFVESRLEL